MIDKASAQGYSAVLNLGSRGISYAANVLVSTAVKVQYFHFLLLYSCIPL